MKGGFVLSRKSFSPQSSLREAAEDAERIRLKADS
jgi:hypothetical protein